MNLSEVIGKDKQRHGGFQVVPLAAESIRQARHSSYPHPHGQVGSFNVAGTNQFAVRIADQWFHDRALQFAGRVARRAFRHSSVNLDKLTKIDPCSKAQRNSIRISLHSVCRKLEVSQRGLVQLLDKDFRIGAAASAKVPRKDDLGVAFDREECPRIALALILRVALIPLLAEAEAPQLVGLYVRHGHLAHLLLQYGLALIASDLEDAEHSRDRNVAYAGRAANATAFAQTVENAIEFFVRQIDRLNGFDTARREGLSTLAAFISGRSVLAVKAMRLRAVDVTGRTVHEITKSFLTGITVRNTMRLRALLGIYGAGQVMSLRGVTSTSSDSRYGLAATVGFKPTEPEGSADLQSAPLNRSGTSPLIQTSSRFPTFFPRLFSHIRPPSRLSLLARSCAASTLSVSLAQELQRRMSKWGSVPLVSHLPLNNLADYVSAPNEARERGGNGGQRIAVMTNAIANARQTVPNLRSGQKLFPASKQFAYRVRQARLFIFFRHFLLVEHVRNINPWLSSEQPKLRDDPLGRASDLFIQFLALLNEFSMFRNGLFQGFLIHTGGTIHDV